MMDQRVIALLLIAGFIAGILFTILALTAFIYLTFFYKFQNHSGDYDPKSGKLEISALKQVQDPQLSLNGVLRISYEILSVSDSLEQRLLEPQQGKDRITSWSQSLSKTLSRGQAMSAFVISRFLGDHAVLVEKQQVALPVPKPYADYYGVLKHKTLHLYSNQDLTECVSVISMPSYRVSLYPNNLNDHELYMAQHPIVLNSNPNNISSLYIPLKIFLYCINSSEKENWFIVLRRASLLPEFADSVAMSLFYHEIDPVKQYTDAMKKLVSHTNNSSSQETAWLNALAGRLFVAIHYNPNVKNWVKKRLSRHTVETDDGGESLLGDIEIQDIHVGNSLPVISNPKLVSIADDGDMMIEMDIDYTGGVRLVLATEATLSVPAWDAYMKPITVPIVVAVKIKKFSARILFKIKSFWETNRIWFGFYRHPELKLELEVEPIISNKLIKLQMVNQVIERRIKDSLEAYVMLPNMDDLSFWDFQDLNGSPFEKENYSTDDELTLEKSNVGLVTPDEMEIRNELENINSVANASLMGEAKESSIESVQKSNLILRRKNPIITHLNETSDGLKSEGYSASVSQESDHEAYTSADESITNRPAITDGSDPSSDNSTDFVEYLGDAAFSLGKISRKYGLDTKAQSLAISMVDYAAPAIKFAEEKTVTYKKAVQTHAARVGLSAIEKLGLKKDNYFTESDSIASLDQAPKDGDGIKPLRHKSSTTWSVMGLSISTSAPTDSKKRNGTDIRSGSLRKTQPSSLASPSTNVGDQTPISPSLESLLGGSAYTNDSSDNENSFEGVAGDQTPKQESI